MAKSKANQKIIQQIFDRQQQIRGRVKSLVNGFTTSLFLWGPGGHGKSHAIRMELNRDPGIDEWQYYNTHISYPALGVKLEQFSDRIHVFEDMEWIISQIKYAGMIRSACGSVHYGPREISYINMNVERVFAFTGAVIIISNLNLADSPVFGAVASRMKPLYWALSDEEMQHLMLEVSSKGASIPIKVKKKIKGRVQSTIQTCKLTQKECEEVCLFVINYIGKKAIDLRTLCDQGFPTYLQDKKGLLPPGLTWKDQLKAIVEGEPTILKSRKQTTTNLMEFAVKCYKGASTKMQAVEQFTNETGSSQAAYYRFIKRAKGLGLIK